jgi:hypothetical protein
MRSSLANRGHANCCAMSFRGQQMQLSAHTISALAAIDEPVIADDTIFRRAAADVMTQAIRVLIADEGVSTSKIVQRLKRLAVELDQPVKIELLFDVIAGLEKYETSNVVQFR